MTRQELLEVGIERSQEFCRVNALEFPELRVILKEDWRFDACAYYRPDYIAICPERCASLGYGGRSWSWPGYVVDRTPYGVIAHELGHMVDRLLSDQKSSYHGDYSVTLRGIVREAPITSYCPNDAEWFAEIFRLFVTNSGLLAQIRPRVFDALSHRFIPVSKPSWQSELSSVVDVPERIVKAARNKIRDVCLAEVRQRRRGRGEG